MTEALRAHEKEKIRRERYEAARKEWKRMHAVDLVLVLEMECERQTKLEEKIEAFKKMLNDKKREVFLREWHGVMLENLEQRKETLLKAKEMEDRHFQRIMRIMVKSWFDAAHGQWSRKGSMDRHRGRMEEAREILEEKLKARGEDVGLITKEMLVEESVRMVMERLEKNRRCGTHARATLSARN
jgi:hypothetical protein